jgi:hypothetical protein
MVQFSNNIVKVLLVIDNATIDMGNISQDMENVSMEMLQVPNAMLKVSMDKIYDSGTW